MLIEMLGLLAAFVIMAASAPQLRAVLRSSATGAEGISITSWSLFLSSTTVWLVYGIKAAAPAVIIGNAMGIVAYLLLVTMLVRARTSSTATALLVFPATALVAGVAWLVPMGVTAATGIAIGIVLAAPQVLASWRTLKSGAHSDVALGSWILVPLGQLLWLSYGLLIGDAAIVLVNVISGAISASVLVLELISRRRMVQSSQAAVAAAGETGELVPVQSH